MLQMRLKHTLLVEQTNVEYGPATKIARHKTDNFCTESNKRK